MFSVFFAVVLVEKGFLWFAEAGEVDVLIVGKVYYRREVAGNYQSVFLVVLFKC